MINMTCIGPARSQCYRLAEGVDGYALKYKRSVICTRNEDVIFVPLE